MKKRAWAIIACALAVMISGNANAIDFKIKGYISNSIEFATNNKFANTKAGNSNDDEFSAGERIRLQLDAVASKALSGVVYFEIGDIYYGNAESGGALGADGKIVELKRAYIDWRAPGTDLKVRMGIQGMKLPLFASSGNFVLDDDAAGIVASYRFNDNVALTGLWSRLLNDNEFYDGGDITTKKGGVKNDSNIGYVKDPARAYDTDNPDHDALDFFSLILPLEGDGFRVSPWVAMAAMGDGVGRNPRKDYNSTFVSTSRRKFQEGMGVYTGTGSAPTLLEYGGGETYTWWGGLSAELTTWEPFSLKFDFIYGSKLGNGSNLGPDSYFEKDNGKISGVLPAGRYLDEDRYNRQGWYVSALAEYKMDHLTPGIFFWYSSGDDDDLNNGSERLPAISGNWEYTHTGFKNTKASGAYDGLIAYSPIGMWGIALQLMDISFIDDLKNHIKVLYMRGTNSAEMPKKVAKSQYELGIDVDGINPTGAVGSYLTTNDWALEVDLDTDWKIYDNLHLIVEMAYIHMDFDKDTWSWNAPDGHKYGRLWRQHPDNPDAFKVGLNFHYTF